MELPYLSGGHKLGPGAKLFILLLGYVQTNVLVTGVCLHSALEQVNITNGDTLQFLLYFECMVCMNLDRDAECIH